MPLNSVNTNVNAMSALTNLAATQMDLATTQSRINTGLKVASAKDNGAIWAIAQNQRATSGSLDAVKDSLQRGSSPVDVGLSAGGSDFTALRDQITKVVNNADFNGANMIKGTGAAQIQALANADGSQVISVQAQ